MDKLEYQASHHLLLKFKSEVFKRMRSALKTYSSLSAPVQKYNFCALIRPRFGLELNDLALNTVLQEVEIAFSIEKWAPFRTMVAVSGGVDSVALLRAMVVQASKSNTPSARENLLVAHVNHATRPDADDDEAFVRELADELGVAFVVANAADLEPVQFKEIEPMEAEFGSDVEQKSDGSITPDSFNQNRSEDALRQIRYRLLVQLAGQNGARFLVTGHQKQDQVETILFRIFRGTGLTGLGGIPTSRLINPALTLIRPLLNLDRESLEQFLEVLNQSYRSDPTNRDSKYTRNFFRNELIPMLVSRFGKGVDDAVLRLSHQAIASQDVLIELACSLIEDAVAYVDDGVQIERAKLSHQQPLVVQTMLTLVWQKQHWSQQKMDARWWGQLAQYLIEDSVAPTRFDLPHGLTCMVDAKQMMIMGPQALIK